MIELWKRTFELFRRHFILWLPCSIAALVAYALSVAKKAARPWLVEYFSTRTQHSVLAGSIQTYDWAAGEHRALMFLTPIIYLKEYLEVCLFVVSLLVTKDLVQAVSDGSMPPLIKALKVARPRLRDILLLSAKYFVLMELLLLATVALAFPYWATPRTLQLLGSRIFTYSVGLIGEGCIVWLLIPSTIRLLRLPGRPNAITTERVFGTLFAVATSVAAFGMQYLATRAESELILDRPWQWPVLGAANTFVTNSPNIVLFIALALLAIGGLSEQQPADTPPDLNQAMDEQS